MSRHRTTARSILAALLLGAVVATAGAASKPPRIVFPVVATVQYTDDFGAPRAGGPHQGIDILAPRKAPAVAVEAGRVKFWTTSATAGCMLYLYGRSGTMYEYIHLNNDLTSRNDNRGRCVAGTAYAPGLKNGARVAAGQQIGFVGDSGDANGLHPHLHFEVHPNGKAAVDPMPYLQAAQHLLFTARAGTAFSLRLTGTVVSTTATRLTMRVSQLDAYPMDLRQTKLAQPLTLALHDPLSADAGESVVVWTEPALATLKAERGDAGALTAALVQVAPPGP